MISSTTRNLFGGTSPPGPHPLRSDRRVLVLDRTSPDEAEGPRNQLRIHLGNGDKLRCNFKRLEKDKLVVETGSPTGSPFP